MSQLNVVVLKKKMIKNTGYCLIYLIYYEVDLLRKSFYNLCHSDSNIFCIVHDSDIILIVDIGNSSNSLKIINYFS